MSTLPEKKIIGITGSMGSGKSQVSLYLGKQYPVLDLDRVNARLLEPGQSGFIRLQKKHLISLLGDGTIDKIKLAEDIFSDSSTKKEVEETLYPLIIESMHHWIDQQTARLVFVEVPLLFENNMQDDFDAVWCVVCEQPSAIERLVLYRGFTPEQALARLQYQMSPKKKCALSQVVIHNDGTLQQLEQQIARLVRKEEAAFE